MQILQLGDFTGENVTGAVISRYNCKNGEKDAGEIGVLSLKAISCGMINKDELQSTKVAKVVPEDKITRGGDVIMKMNQPYDSVYIDNECSGLLIPSFCCIIRNINFELVDPYYLVSFLNSKFAKEYLMASNRSSAASLLKIKDIKKLPVPLPTMMEQRAIGEIFKVCCERQELLTKMKKHEMELAEGILIDTVREAFENNEVI